MKDGTIVLISYNSVKGFSSGWHSDRKVYVCANDAGLGRKTGDGTDRGNAGAVMHSISGRYYHGEVPVDNVAHYYVYAGLYAFESAISMAQRLNQEAPDTPVTVVACDCSWREKQRMLRGTGISLEKCACGGQKAMGRIAFRHS